MMCDGKSVIDTNQTEATLDDTEIDNILKDIDFINESDGENNETIHQNIVDKCSNGKLCSKETNADAVVSKLYNDIKSNSDEEKNNPKPTMFLRIDGFPPDISPKDIKCMVSEHMAKRNLTADDKIKKKKFRTSTFVFRKDPDEPTCILKCQNIKIITKVYEYLKSNSVIEGYRVTIEYENLDDSDMPSTAEYPAIRTNDTTTTTNSESATPTATATVTPTANDVILKYFGKKSCAPQFLVVDQVPSEMHPIFLRQQVIEKVKIEKQSKFLILRDDTKEPTYNIHFDAVKECHDMYKKLQNLYIKDKKVRVRLKSGEEFIKDPVLPDEKLQPMKRAHSNATLDDGSIEGPTVKRLKTEEESKITPGTVKPEIPGTPNPTTTNTEKSKKDPEIDAFKQYKSVRRVWRKSDFYNETFGLTPEFLKSLGVKLPLGTKIRVGHLNESITQDNEDDLRRVFSMAGKVMDIRVFRRAKRISGKHYKVQTYANIDYDHPTEAVQAISMFNKRVLCGCEMLVCQEVVCKTLSLPPGLESVGPGLGPKGLPLSGLRQRIELQRYKQALKELGKDILSESDLSEYFNWPSSKEVIDLTRPEENQQSNDLNQPAITSATAQAPNQVQTNELSTVVQSQVLNAVQNIMSQVIPILQTNQNQVAAAPQNLAQQSLNRAQPNIVQNKPIFNSNLAQAVQNVPSLNSKSVHTVQYESSCSTKLAQYVQIPAFNPNIAQNYQYSPFISQNFSVSTSSANPAFSNSACVQPVWNSSASTKYFSEPQPSRPTQNNEVSKVAPSTDGNNKTTLLFSQLPPSVTTEALKSKMRAVGELIFCETSGLGRAVVRFKHDRDAQRCIKLFNGSKVNGQVIKAALVNYMPKDS